MKKSTILMFASLALLIFGLLGFISRAYAENSMAGCAKQCSDCQAACEKASAYCKEKGGQAASAENQKKFADCIDICKTSHSFLGRDSKFHPEVCKVCADVCRECAKACESLHDPKLKDCIEQCNKCADSCKHMAS